MSKATAIDFSSYVKNAAQEAAVAKRVLAVQRKKDDLARRALETRYVSAARQIAQPLLDGINQWRTGVKQKPLEQSAMYVDTNRSYKNSDTKVTIDFRDDTFSRMEIDFKNGRPTQISVSKRYEGPAHEDDMSSFHHHPLVRSDLSSDGKMPATFHQNLAKLFI